MYTSVDFSSQIIAQRGSLVPQTRVVGTSFDLDCEMITQAMELKLLPLQQLDLSTLRPLTVGKALPLATFITNIETPMSQLSVKETSFFCLTSPHCMQPPQWLPSPAWNVEPNAPPCASDPWLDSREKQQRMKCVVTMVTTHFIRYCFSLESSRELGLKVKNICFLLKGQGFKSRGG
jgi:hypothetical protein